MCKITKFRRTTLALITMASFNIEDIVKSLNNLVIGKGNRGSKIKEQRVDGYSVF